MTDSYFYFPDPVQPNNTFNLTYTASKILAPESNYNLLTSTNTIISSFNPIYTFCKGTGIYNPKGIDTDSNGNLFIINSSTNSLVFLDILTKECTTILIQLDNPSSICFDKINNCFYLILDGNGADGHYNVNKYVNNNNYWIQDPTFTSITNLTEANYLTIGNNNILYVENKNISNSNTQISTYNLLTSELITLSITSNVNNINTLSFDLTNNILFYSNNNNQIGEATVNSSGDIISSNNSWSSGYNNIIYSSFADSYLYILDIDNSQIGTIYKIDSNGTSTIIKSNITNPAGLVTNVQIVYYASDTYQINSINNNIISNVVDSITGINGPIGVIFVNDINFIPNETLFIVNNFNQTISKVDSNGVVSEFISQRAGLQNPTAIIYSNNYLYVTQPDANSIAQIDKYGIINILQLDQIFNSPEAIVYNNKYNKFYLTGYDTDGNSIVTTYNLLSNTQTVLLNSERGLQQASGLWFDTNNVLYIANQQNPGFISSCSINSDGITVDTFNLNYQNVNLNNPRGIVTDNFNNIYIANDYNVLDPSISSNGVISISAADPIIIEPPPPPLTPTIFGNSPLIQFPQGIILDYTGNLFIANFTTFSILKANTHELNFINIEGSSLNAGNNTLHINDPFNLVNINVNVLATCFLEDTNILTVNGYRKIQDLRKGDLIKTFKNEFKSIDMIGYKNLNHNFSLSRIKEQLYKCSKEKYPELFQDLIITGCHSILIDNFVKDELVEKVKEVFGQIYVTENKYRLPIFLDERSDIYENSGTYKVYHIALENDNYYTNYGMYANGLLTESCSKRYLKELSGMKLI
jgi:hypothetical protein